MKLKTFISVASVTISTMGYAVSAHAWLNTGLNSSVGIGLSVQASISNSPGKAINTDDPYYGLNYEHGLVEFSNQTIERPGFDDHGNPTILYLQEQNWAFAYANLSTGQLKTIALASPPVQVFDSNGRTFPYNWTGAYAFAEMRDILHFKIPLSMFDSNGVANIPVSFLFEGTIYPNYSESQGEAMNYIYLTGDNSYFAHIRFLDRFYRDAVGDFDPSNGVEVDNLGFGNGNVTTADNIHWNSSIVFDNPSLHAVDSIFAEYTFNFYSSLQAITFGTIVDYGNTAGISFDLPQGVLLTSDSGVFLTAAVPEPETYAMLLAGLGLIGFSTRYKKHRNVGVNGN